MQKDQPDHIDDVFKDALGSFEDRPRQEIWERIGQELDEDKKRAYIPLFRSLSPIAAVLLVLVIAIGIMVHMHTNTELTHASLPLSPISPSAQSPRPAIVSMPDELSRTPESSRPATLYRTPGPQLRNSLSIRRSSSSTGPTFQSALFSRAGATTTAAWATTPVSLNKLLSLATRLSNTTATVLQLAPLKTSPYIAGIPSLLARHFTSIRKDNPVHLTPDQHRWSITPYFSQELAGYNLADHDSIGARGKEIDKKQTSLSSASTGALAGYQLTKKWLLQTGLIYSWSRSLSNPSTAYAVADNNGNIKYQLNTISGYGYLNAAPAAGDSVKTGRSSSRLHYLSIPIIASCTFKKGKLKFLAGAGVMANLLMGATVQSRIEGSPSSQAESIVTMYGLRKVNYGLIVKTETQYTIRANWSLNLMLTSKNTTTAINTNTHYSTYPYYIGLGLGLQHSF